MSDELTHVTELAGRIGPRPATTDKEAEAADYIQGVFEARGMEVERQEFDSQRTYGWAYVLYHLLTIVAAVASRWLGWPAFVLALAVAVLMRFDLDTRFGLTSIMPKGPSQNLIARHIPRVGRNERARRVVVVAHYDSARSSLAFSPGMVRNFSATFGLMKWCTYLAPLFILVSALPWTQGWMPWTWYVTLAAAAYLLIPLFINIHRELFMKPVPGANDNASGVGVLLTLMERVVPEPEIVPTLTGSIPRVQHGEAEARSAEVLPPDAVLTYAPAATPATWAGPVEWADDEDDWTDGRTASAPQETMRIGFAEPTPEESATLFGGTEPAETAPAEELTMTQPSSDALFGTGGSAPARAVVGGTPSAPPQPAYEEPVDDGPVYQEPPAASSYEPAAPSAYESAPPVLEETGPLYADDDVAGIFDDDDHVETSPMMTGPVEHEPIPERRGLFGRFRKDRGEKRDVRAWLGVGDDFDARKEGKSIGTWGNFDEEHEDDDIGWKGGAASIDDIDDPGFSASEAARIRRKVTLNTDRELAEKEVWFVATGAEEAGCVGMRALVREYGDELDDAFIINIDNVGSGSVVYVTSEGMAKRYHSDRRMIGAAKRVIREREMTVKGHDYKGLSTDATPALARGFRAMSVMAFDINGRLPNWHWSTDTVENVSVETMAAATDFVAELVKEL